jgi:hypothetical protein
MNAKALLFYILGSVSVIIAVILFFKWLDWKFLLPLALGIAAVVFFWMGSTLSNKNRT